MHPPDGADASPADASDSEALKDAAESEDAGGATTTPDAVEPDTKRPPLIDADNPSRHDVGHPIAADAGPPPDVSAAADTAVSIDLGERHPTDPRVVTNPSGANPPSGGCAVDRSPDKPLAGLIVLALLLMAGLRPRRARHVGRENAAIEG